MSDIPPIVTVSFNPAIDRVIEVHGFAVGLHQKGREVARTPGGKAVNVSRVLAALGVASEATGFLGLSSRGEFTSLFAEGSRIHDAFLLLPGRTRENVTISDPDTHTDTHIRETGPTLRGEDFAGLSERVLTLSAAGRTIVFSGSLPPGVSPADQARLVQQCAATGARVAVDTSGAALTALRDEDLWLLKPNTRELAEFVGRDLSGPAERLAAAREMTGRIRNVLLSGGADGAFLVQPDGAWHARCEIAEHSVRNTVGCGDALLGAFLAGEGRGDTSADALAFAVAVATAAACSDTSATFDADLADQLRDRVTVETV